MSEPVTTSEGCCAQAATATPLDLLSPVVARELRTALHRRDIRKSRSKVARLGVLGVSLFMLFGGAVGTASWGGMLHFYLFIAALSLAVGPAIQSSVGLFAEERRQQTMELLYLAGMGPAELFAGKLLGAVLVSSSELLALAPLFAIPFLSGGISFDLFLHTAACLPTIFVLVLSVSALAAALCRQESTALIISGVLIGACCLALPLPYNLGLWVAGKTPFASGWLVLSPALGPWMVARKLGGFRPGEFWLWATITWGWSALSLVTAAAVLRGNWRREVQRTGAEGWRAKWEAFVLGGTRWRTALRRRVLAANAYQWLAQQDRLVVLEAWALMAAVGAFWLLGLAVWGRVWSRPLDLYATAAILLLGIDLLTSYAAARRLAGDRQNGALELLLTTPLGPDEILSGQKAALAEQFAPVKQALCGLLVLMVGVGWWSRTWTPQGLVSYLAVWGIFFAWCWRPAPKAAPMAMWVAANCGRPLHVAFRSRGPWSRAWSLYWLWLLANSLGAFGGFARAFPRGSTLEMFVTISAAIWLLLVVLSAGRSSNSMAGPFISQLRLIAQQPLPERNDPRFKKWKDIRTPFPAAAGDGLAAEDEPAAETKAIKAAGAWFWRPVGRVCGLAWGKFLRAAAHR